MNPIHIPSPRQKQMQLHTYNYSSVTPTLFNYEDLIHTNSPYNTSKFRLNHYQLKKWMDSKGALEDNIEVSEHESVGDEEENKQREATPAMGGPQSIFEFYKKYKGIQKSTVQSNVLKNSSTYKYLKTIDKLHFIPEPMGIAKWKGASTELSLGYFMKHY